MYITKQWPAVRMVLWLMMDPPQKWRPDFLRDTWYGNLPTGASLPPTMWVSGKPVTCNETECKTKYKLDLR